jgi:hypothetical protein
LRFCGVSGTGPLVTVRLVKVADVLLAVEVADGAAVLVSVVVVVEVDAVELVSPAGGAVTSVEAAGGEPTGTVTFS